MTELAVGPEAVGHSRIGIASIVLAVLGGLLGCAIAGYIIYRSRNPGTGGLDGLVLAGLAMFAAMAIQFTGLALGVIGALMRRRRRKFAWLGLAINGCLFATTIALFFFRSSFS
jgi:hypothetical protein